MPGGDIKLPRSRNAVVVAHPDDEALWLSAVVASVERVVFGFGADFDKPQRPEAQRFPMQPCASVMKQTTRSFWKACAHLWLDARMSILTTPGVNTATPNTFKSTGRSLPCRMSSDIQSGSRTTWAPKTGPSSEVSPSAWTGRGAAW